MLLPEKVRIGPFDYNVQSMPERESRDLHLSGHYSGRTLLIRVDREQADQVVIETLFHEVDHAIFDLAGVDDKTPVEDIITRTSPLRLAVYRDNPQLVALIEWLCQ